MGWQARRKIATGEARAGGSLKAGAVSEIPLPGLAPYAAFNCGAHEWTLRQNLPPFATPRCSSLQTLKNAPCSLSQGEPLQHIDIITKFESQRIGSPCNF